VYFVHWDLRNKKGVEGPVKKTKKKKLFYIESIVYGEIMPVEVKSTEKKAKAHTVPFLYFHIIKADWRFD